MSELGEFLERFYSPEPTFRTLRASVRHTKKASADGAPAARRLVIGRRKSDEKPQDESEETLMLWAIPPDHVRIEKKQAGNGQTKNTLEVVNAENTWKCFADGTVQQGAGSIRPSRGQAPLPTEYQRHFDGGLIRDFFAALTLEATESFRVAGRRCVCFRAVEVPGKQIWPHWLPSEADSFMFAADVDRAVLLSIAGTVADVVVETHEVVEVAFDEELDESLFIYEPGPEERVEPATPVVERITVTAAIARVPFTVLQPTWLPESDRLQCETMLHPARPDCPDVYLMFHYHGGTSFSRLWINQRSQREKRMHEELQWEVVNVGGRRLEVSDPSPDEGLRVVVFEQDGTWIDIVSDMPLDELQKLAVSFQPVR